MSQSKVCNSSSKRCQIITDNGQRATILDNHVCRSNRAEGVDNQVTRGTFDTEDLTLAILRSRKGGTSSAVVVEEAVQTSSVHDDVRATENAETEGITVSGETAAVVRVVQGGVGRVWSVGCVGIGLVVPGRCQLQSFQIAGSGYLTVFRSE